VVYQEAAHAAELVGLHRQDRHGEFLVGRQAERPGAILVVSLPCAHPGNWLGLATGTVLPAMVASGITLALAGGWQPSRPGPAFTLTMEDPVGVV
jgi:hypothetical protein